MTLQETIEYADKISELSIKATKTRCKLIASETLKEVRNDLKMTQLEKVLCYSTVINFITKINNLSLTDIVGEQDIGQEHV